MKTFQTQLGFGAYLLIAALYLLIQGAIVWFFLPRPSFIRTNLFLLPMGALLLWSLHRFSSTSKVMVDAKGFVWRRGRVSLEAAWSNVSHLGKMNEGDATTHGIFLRTPVPTKLDSKGLLPASLVDPKTMDYVPLSGIVQLPIKGTSINKDALRATPFGRELLEHAPHVYQER